MAKKRIYDDGALSSSEKSRRRSDRFAQIDNEFDSAVQNINWNRRTKAEGDIVQWVQTYAVGLLLEDDPPERGEQILRQMDQALTSHQNYMILMGRGQGKSCYAVLSALFAIVTGKQKFLLIVSNNSRAATNLLQDIWRIISEPDTDFACDYPDVCLPFTLCAGSFRRRQYYNGKSTNIVRNAGNIGFARLVKADGTEYPSSQAMIATRGYSSGLRGLRNGKQRVTAVIIDDVQDSETAANPEQVQKLVDVIRKDIMPMGGKERLSILQTATPIQPDDLVDVIRKDTNWITQTYPVIIQYPQHMELWEAYFKLFDAENANEKPHDESLTFYRQHFAEMNAGADVFNPSRFSTKDGHISAIQKMLEFRHLVGDSAFQAECQMEPVKYKLQLDITPKMVLQKISDFAEGEVPDGYVYVVASSDLNLSFCISTTVVAFKRDLTATVIKYIFRKCNVDGKQPTTEYERQVYALLSQHGRELSELGVKIDAWSVDANGVPFDVVTEFTKHSVSICGIPSCGFIGKAAHVYNPYVKSRLRNEVNRTVLCGDAEEHVKSGAGKKYVLWDSDFYREQVQKGFLADFGATGSITLYKADESRHADFAVQITNEKLRFKKDRPDGRREYFWKSNRHDHDMLDSLAQALATAAMHGLGELNQTHTRPVTQAKKRKYRIV